MVLPTRSRTVPRTTTITDTVSPARRGSTVSNETWGRGNHDGTSITTRTGGVEGARGAQAASATGG